MIKRVYLILIFLIAALSAFSATKRSEDSYNYIRGYEALENENYSEAYEYFLRELADNPKNGNAYLWLGVIYQAVEDYANALSYYDMALKYISKKDKEFLSQIHNQKGTIYSYFQDYDTAIQEYTEALQLMPKDIDLLNERGYVYYVLEQYDLAENDYRTITKLESTNPLGYMGLGRNAVAQGDYYSAVPFFDRAIQVYDNYALAYSWRAECYINLEEWDNAVSDLIVALDLDDDKAFLLMQTLTGDAFDTLSSKLKIKSLKEPFNEKWLYYNGVIHEHNGMQKKALDYYLSSYKLNNNASVCERIANCYYDLGDFSQALLWIDKTIESSPSALHNVFKANTLYDLGDIDNAIVEINKVIEEYPEAMYGHYRRGFFEIMNGKTDEAIEDFSLAIALDPTYAYAYLLRGDAYKKKGDFIKAKKDYEKILELETTPISSSCAQFALCELDKKPEAIEFMDAIIAGSYDNPEDYVDAARLYSRLGMKDKALGSLMTALEKGYNRCNNLMLMYDLEAIRGTSTFKNLINEYQAKFETTNNTESKQKNIIEEVVTVPFTKEGGVCKVKCTINDLPLYFIFDTGASSVSLSLVEANFMMKNEYLKQSDVIGSQNFIDANGDITEGTIINLSHVDFGGLDIPNVRASVVRNQKAPLLLGQSVLSRLGKIEIDNENNLLIITHSKIIEP